MNPLTGTKKNAKQTRSDSGSAHLPEMGKVMPESKAAEAAVLGSMIIDPECIGVVVESLKSADAFYRIEHQMIFDALVSLYEKNRAGGLDGVLLRDELEKQKQLEEVGGVDYLGAIVDSVPTTANLEYYLGIVKEKRLMREMISAATEILRESYDQSGEIGEKLDKAEELIFKVTESTLSGDAAPLKDLVSRAYEMIEERDGTLVTGLDTHYSDLNNMTCGLQKGEMIIVAGRPSMGKTALAVNIAENMAVKSGIPAAIFSMEMSKEQLTERILCSYSRVDSQSVRRGLLSTEQYHELAAACMELGKAPIYIDDTAGLTPLELRAKARRLKSRHKIEAIFIDYLQLMNIGTGRSESRQQEITTISRYIKALARELNIPVVVLSQLNRAAESREGHRPRMSDLRESGSIEQDADVIMLLHREDYYHKDEEGYVQNGVAEVIIAKQRNGPTGAVQMLFQDKITRFDSLSRHTDESF
ncbi:MAG: replicative DNA helicase [Phycisphaerae bacterium]|nr:replicative DNA helicase [Phycisphaerae bacterium]